jgi:hypothetical protein
MAQKRKRCRPVGRRTRLEMADKYEGLVALIERIAEDTKGQSVPSLVSQA